MKYTFLAAISAVSILIALTAPQRPMIKPVAPAAIPSCADGVALAALLNERRVGMGDGSYATCRIHHLPKGEHVNETL